MADPLVLESQQHPVVPHVPESQHVAVAETQLEDMPLQSLLHAHDASIPALLHLFDSSEGSKSTFDGFGNGQGAQDRQQLEEIIDQVQDMEGHVDSEGRGTEAVHSPVYAQLQPAAPGLTVEQVVHSRRPSMTAPPPLSLYQPVGTPPPPPMDETPSVTYNLDPNRTPTPPPENSQPQSPSLLVNHPPSRKARRKSRATPRGAHSPTLRHPPALPATESPATVPRQSPQNAPPQQPINSNTLGTPQHTSPHPIATPRPTSPHANAPQPGTSAPPQPLDSRPLDLNGFLGEISNLFANATRLEMEHLTLFRSFVENQQQESRLHSLVLSQLKETTLCLKQTLDTHNQYLNEMSNQHDSTYSLHRDLAHKILHEVRSTGLDLLSELENITAAIRKEPPAADKNAPEGSQQTQSTQPPQGSQPTRDSIFPNPKLGDFVGQTVRWARKLEMQQASKQPMTQASPLEMQHLQESPQPSTSQRLQLQHLPGTPQQSPPQSQDLILLQTPQTVQDTAAEGGGEVNAVATSQTVENTVAEGGGEVNAVAMLDPTPPAQVHSVAPTVVSPPMTRLRSGRGTTLGTRGTRGKRGARGKK